MTIVDMVFNYMDKCFKYFMGGGPSCECMDRDEEELETFRVWFERSFYNEEDNRWDMDELYIEDIEAQKKKIE